MGISADQFYVIDDESTDGTGQWIKSNFPNIRYEFNSIGKGYIPNRSRMMTETKRNFVLSLDDDSHVRSELELQTALALLASKKEYGIYHFRIFNQIAPPPPSDALPATIQLLRSYIGCGHIIKREVINSLGAYFSPLEFYGEELEYSIRAYQKGWRVVTQDNLVVHHRIDRQVRKASTNSDLSKGVYGKQWRDCMLYSNNIVITELHYPWGLKSLFSVYRLWLCFVATFVKDRNFAVVVEVVKRIVRLRKVIYATRKDAFTTTELYTWLKSPVITSDMNHFGR